MKDYTDNDKGIIKSLGFLQMLFPRFQLSDEAIAAYVRILSDLPAELIEKSAEELGSRNTFFPAAGEIRTAAFDLIGRQHGIPSSYEAWGEVVRAISSVGHWGVPEFSHPLIKTTVDSIGGWLILCASDSLVADRARFVAAFDLLVSREKHDIRTLPGVRKYSEQLDAGKVDAAIKRIAAKMGSNDFKSSLPVKANDVIGLTEAQIAGRNQP